MKPITKHCSVCGKEMPNAHPTKKTCFKCRVERKRVYWQTWYKKKKLKKNYEDHPKRHPAIKA